MSEPIEDAPIDVARTLRGSPSGAPATTTVHLKSFEFRREREASWREFERLVTQVERRGIRSLTARELSRLPILYRSVLSSLSLARSISLDKNVVAYLEALTARGYFCVYGVKRNPIEAVRTFIASTFPATVRRFRWHMLIAGTILLAGMAVGMIRTWQNPDNFFSFVPAELAQGRDPSTSHDELEATLHGEGASLAFSSFLFTHNAKIGIVCFAFGFLAGIPVFISLLTNGLVLGAFTALFHSKGLGLEVWGWLLPHGVTELLAIVLCGGAGLMLAEALVFPGRHSRLVHLGRRGRQAGVVVIGAVGMLIIAGLMEGIFRQAVHSTPVRYAVALSFALLWTGYFMQVGRSSERGRGPRSPTGTRESPTFPLPEEIE